MAKEWKPSKKDWAARKVAICVDGCHHCPFISEHGMKHTKFSNIRCDLLNKALPKYRRILKDCPLPNYRGRFPILTEEQQEDVDMFSNFDTPKY